MVQGTSDKKNLITSTPIAVGACLAYCVFSISAIRTAVGIGPVHTRYAFSTVDLVTYCFCLFVFIEIRRGVPSLSEKTFAIANVAAVMGKLISAICVQLQLSRWYLHVSAWATAVFLVIATIAVIVRTLKLVRAN